MKTTRILSLAALALVMAACSNDNELVPQQPEKSEGIPFTATISGESITRALNEVSGSLQGTWEVGEKVALCYTVGSDKYCDKAEVKSVDGSGTATIDATLEKTPSDGDPVTVIYPYTAAVKETADVKNFGNENQDGTLAYISTNCDVRKGTGTFSVSGGKATLKSDVTLENQFCIFKMTLKDIDGTNDLSVNIFEVYDEENNRLGLVYNSSTYSTCYIALPTTSSTLKFRAINQTTDKQWCNKKSGLTLGKNYYQSTLKLATFGDVILTDGSFAKAGTSGAAAMIFFIDPGFKAMSFPNVDTSGNWFGLAIALEDVTGGPYMWSNVNEAVSGVSTSTDIGGQFEFMTGIANTTALLDPMIDPSTDHAAAKAVDGYSVYGFDPTTCGFSNWFLPSTVQLAYCITVSSSTAMPDTWNTYPTGGGTDVTELNAMLNAAGGAKAEFEAVDYWTSCQYDEDEAVSVTFSPSEGAKVSHTLKANGGNVRPFIAF